MAPSESSPVRKAGPPRLAYAVANFHAPFCTAWAAGSRRSLNAIEAIRWPLGSVEDGLAVLAEALMGMQAMERAVRSARWIAANRPDAFASLMEALAAAHRTMRDLDLYHWRIWRLRNRVLEHLDEKFLQGDLSKIWIAEDAIHLSDGHAFGFAEWRGWLDAIEPWANRVVRDPLEPGPAVARTPTAIRDHKPPEAD